MTAADFRRIALSLEGVEEDAHVGLPAFRVGGRRFASLAADTEWANKAGGRWQALSHSAPTSPTYIG